MNEAGEKILAARLRQHLRPVSLSDGKLEVQIDGDVKQENFLGDLARFMSQKSGQPWLVSQAAQGGGQTLAELDRQADEQKKRPPLNILLLLRFWTNLTALKSQLCAHTTPKTKYIQMMR